MLNLNFILLRELLVSFNVIVVFRLCHIAMVLKVYIWLIGIEISNLTVRETDGCLPSDWRILYIDLCD